jgi:hypothetical protein
MTPMPETARNAAFEQVDYDRIIRAGGDETNKIYIYSRATTSK